MSAGLEMVHSLAEKQCIASYYRQFSTNIKLIPVLLLPINLIFFYFIIHGKLFIIRSDKYQLVERYTDKQTDRQIDRQTDR